MNPEHKNVRRLMLASKLEDFYEVRRDYYNTVARLEPKPLQIEYPPIDSKDFFNALSMEPGTEIPPLGLELFSFMEWVLDRWYLPIAGSTPYRLFAIALHTLYLLEQVHETS